MADLASYPAERDEPRLLKLDIKLPWMDGIERAKRPVRVPVVLTIDEVRALLARPEGTRWMMASPLDRIEQERASHGHT